jgi:hypothetical protein
MFSVYKGFEDKEKILYKRYVALGTYLFDKEAKRERSALLQQVPLSEESELLFVLQSLLTQTRLRIGKLENDLAQPHHRRIRTVLSYCLDTYKEFYASIQKLQGLATGRCFYSMCPLLQKRISDHPEKILNSLFADVMKDRFWLAVFYRSSSLFRIDQEAFQAMLRSIEDPKQWEKMEFNGASMACHPLLPDPDDFLHATGEVSTSPWKALYTIEYQSESRHIKYYKNKVIFAKPTNRVEVAAAVHHTPSDKAVKAAAAVNNNYCG